MSVTTDASPYDIAPCAERSLRRGLEFGAAYRWHALAASVLLIGSVGATRAQAVLISWVIDRGVLEKDMNALSLSLFLLLGAVVAEAALSAGRQLLFAWFGERYLARMRSRVFERLSQLSLRFYDAHNAGELISRASDDVQTLSSFVRTGLGNFLTGILLLVLGVVVMGSLSPPLLAVSLISVPLLRWLSRRYGRRAEPAQPNSRERYAAGPDVIEQGLSGARSLHLFRRLQAWGDSVDRRQTDEYHARMRVASLNNRYFPWLEFTWVFATAATVGAGAGLNSMGMVTVGIVSAFVLSLTKIFGPLESLGRLFGEAQAAKASLGRIFALLDVPLEVKQRPGAAEPATSGHLEASEVTFSYALGRPLLREINLSVQPCETLAPVGRTGAGKSTLARLLARLYDPDLGHISYGGLDLKDAKLASVRRRIVLLPQEGHLLWGTVADNIGLFRPETPETEISKLVADLGLDERFGQFPDGLQTEADARGARLSAGERRPRSRLAT